MKLAGVALVLVGAVVGALLAGSFGKAPAAGGVYSQSEQTFGQGLSVGTARQFVISNAGVITSAVANTWASAQTFTADAVFSGGVGGIDITTSNSATSSAVFGCWTSYATSTATALKLQFTASTTAPTNGSGVIPVVSYGACS